MKKQYIIPQSETTPLQTEYSLCLTSLERLMLEEGLLDPDSD